MSHPTSPTRSPSRLTPRRALGTAVAVTVLVAPLILATTTPAVAAARVSSVLTVAWGDSTPKVAQKVSVTGTVTPAEDGREVSLERQRANDTWAGVTSTTTASGAFELRLPTSAAGSSTYRVNVAPTDTAERDVSSPRRVVVSRRTTSINATLSAIRVRVDGRVFVAGRVNPNWNRRHVQLQRRVPGRWVPASGVRRIRGASYRLRVPTGWYGTFRYRVVVRRTGYATARVSPVRRLRVVPRYRPAGPARAHRMIVRGGARWNACRPIHYKVNARQGGRGALADVRGAVSQIERATGLNLVYTGRTRAIPQFDGSDWWGRRTDFVIAWARPRQTPGLRGAPESVVGVGGPVSYFHGYRNPDGSRTAWIARGGVVLDSTDRFKGGLGSGYTRGEIVLHEIGHAVGLHHTWNRRQVMYPSMTPYRGILGAGDLAGLDKVGANQGCVYDRRGVLARMRETRTKVLPLRSAFVRDDFGREWLG